MESALKIDVTLLPPSHRHQVIFKALEVLKNGHELILSVDHNPAPLYYEMKVRFPKIFSWEFLEEGPVVWQVLITKRLIVTEKKVADLVQENAGLTSLFEEFGIDYCCQGNITLEEACRRRKVDVDELLLAMKKQGVSGGTGWQPHFESWSSRLLIQYIIENHHVWERQALDEVNDLAVKVAEHHGSDYPNLKKVKELVAHLRGTIISHFAEEEEQLFPMMLEGSKSRELLKELDRMKTEHVDVGAMLTDLTLLTSNFQAPEDTCDSFHFLYQKLKELKYDMRQHIHLENNILAAKATT